jgi:hypothetical protein
VASSLAEIPTPQEEHRQQDEGGSNEPTRKMAQNKKGNTGGRQKGNPVKGAHAVQVEHL